VQKQDRLTASSLEKLIINALSQDKDLRPECRRRLEIMLRTRMGQSQAEICKALGCSQDTARYWMAIAQTEQAEKYIHSIGRPKTVNDRYLERLKELVSDSPKTYGYAFSQWTAQWLRKHLAKELGIEVSDRHINRLLKQMGLSTRNQNQAPPNNSWRKAPIITIADLQPVCPTQLEDTSWML
jgi:transposase